MRCYLLAQQEQHSDWFGKVSTNVDNRRTARQPMTKFVHSRQVTGSSLRSYGRIGDDSWSASRSVP
jgi:hypothetical protein